MYVYIDLLNLVETYGGAIFYGWRSKINRSPPTCEVARFPFGTFHEARLSRPNAKGKICPERESVVPRRPRGHALTHNHYTYRTAGRTQHISAINLETLTLNPNVLSPKPYCPKAQNTNLLPSMPK